MRLIFVILIIVFLGLQYKLWLGEDGVRQWRQLEKKIISKTEENEKQLVRNQAIEADILELKQGDQALEEQARSELGMIKEGETYYQFSDSPHP